MKRKVLFILISLLLGLASTTYAAWPWEGAASKTRVTALIYNSISQTPPSSISERYFVSTPQQLQEQLQYLEDFQYPAILIFRKDDPETKFYVDRLVKPKEFPYVFYTFAKHRNYSHEFLLPVLPKNPPPNGSYPVLTKEMSGLIPKGDFSTFLPNRYLNNACFNWNFDLRSCLGFSLLFTILTVCFGLLSKKRPKLSSSLIMFILPWYPVRLVLFGLPVTLLEIMMLISILVWLPITIRAITKTRHFLPIILLILTFLVIGVSLITRASSLTAFGYARAFLIIPIIWVISFLQTIKDKSGLAWPGYGYIAGALVVSLFTLTRYISGDAYIHFDGQLRATFFGNPNHLAAYLAPAFILGLGLWFNNRKNLLLFISTLLATTIGLTISKGAYLGVAGGLCYFIIAPRISILKKYIPLLVMGGLGIILIAQLIFAARGTYTIPNSSPIETIHSSTASRIAVYQTSMIMLNKSPIFGIGLANFRENFQSLVSSASPEQDTTFAHNIFLDVWLQLGILGLYVFLIWLSGAFHIPQEKDRRLLAFIFQAALVSRLIHGLVDSVLLKNDFSVLIIFLIGSLWWLNYYGKSKTA